jgi:predicted transcriptional regulator
MRVVEQHQAATLITQAVLAGTKKVEVLSVLPELEIKAIIPLVFSSEALSATLLGIFGLHL